MVLDCGGVKRCEVIAQQAEVFPGNCNDERQDRRTGNVMCRDETEDLLNRNGAVGPTGDLDALTSWESGDGRVRSSVGA